MKTISMAGLLLTIVNLSTMAAQAEVKYSAYNSPQDAQTIIVGREKLTNHVSISIYHCYEVFLSKVIPVADFLRKSCVAMESGWKKDTGVLENLILSQSENGKKTIAVFSQVIPVVNGGSRGLMALQASLMIENEPKSDQDHVVYTETAISHNQEMTIDPKISLQRITFKRVSKD